MAGIFIDLSNKEPLVYLPPLPKYPCLVQVLLIHREEHLLAGTTEEVYVGGVIR